MRNFCLLVAIISLALCAFAQNSPIPTHTFNLNASPISLPGDKGTFVGTDAGIAISFSQNFALAQTNIMSSTGKLAFFGGGAEYSAPVLSRWINDHSQLSGFRLRLGVRAFAGVARVKNDLGTVAQHWGGMAQGTFAYSFDSGAHYQFGANVGMARFPGYAKGWTPVVEVGPQFHF